MNHYVTQKLPDMSVESLAVHFQCKKQPIYAVSSKHDAIVQSIPIEDLTRHFVNSHVSSCYEAPMTRQIAQRLEDVDSTYEKPLAKAFNKSVMDYDKAYIEAIMHNFRKSSVLAPSLQTEKDAKDANNKVKSLRSAINSAVAKLPEGQKNVPLVLKEQETRVVDYVKDVLDKHYNLLLPDTFSLIGPQTHVR